MVEQEIQNLIISKRKKTLLKTSSITGTSINYFDYNDNYGMPYFLKILKPVAFLTLRFNFLNHMTVEVLRNVRNVQ